MSEIEQKNQGSFSSGLVVGVLAGAVGYFLTRTEEGKQVREKFIDQWQDLKKSLVADGAIKESEPEITDYIQALRSKISDFLGDHAGSSSVPKQAKKKSKKTRKKKLFEGI